MVMWEQLQSSLPSKLVPFSLWPCSNPLPPPQSLLSFQEPPQLSSRLPAAYPTSQLLARPSCIASLKPPGQPDVTACTGQPRKKRKQASLQVLVDRPARPPPGVKLRPTGGKEQLPVAFRLAVDPESGERSDELSFRRSMERLGLLKEPKLFKVIHGCCSKRGRVTTAVVRLIGGGAVTFFLSDKQHLHGKIGLTGHQDKIPEIRAALAPYFDPFTDPAGLSRDEKKWLQEQASCEKFAGLVPGEESALHV
ncbi:unnamed protein product [Polarella glacialis]|uniref:Uncharacterized protein n=1 Tax=Polarella glacialis TaxID=89957 RepID=A0A813LEH4_POLGL|nr:unnamed protein product [Polarella glacialis]